MKVFICLFFMIGIGINVQAQFEISSSRLWENYPPEIQKPGFWLFQTDTVQMDDDAAFEEVLLFSSDNGHYPYFDLFKRYYVILDNYSKTIQYSSEITISTKRDLKLEDRNKDGKFELYLSYFKNGDFSVDKKGNNLSVEWVYDTIEWKEKNDKE